MDSDLIDVFSDCSSELSETQSELESRIYSFTHHNDFSGTSELPCIDPRYGVEFNSNGEAIVYLKDPSEIEYPIKLPEVCNNSVIPTITLDNSVDVYLKDPVDVGIKYPIKLPEVYNNSVIPTITLDDSEDVLEISNVTASVIDYEYAETSLKKKRKRKKKTPNDASIEEYINIVKTTDALEEYKKKSGLYKMNPKSKKSDNVSLNVAIPNEPAMPLSPNEVLKQYRIGKPTECSLWYRCPKTWTPDMIKFYTRIQKSKRNFDCSEELKKIKGEYQLFTYDILSNF